MNYIIRSQVEKELYHHGVLGMHWGIRRYQPYPKGKHGKFIGQDRDKDIIVKKGGEAYRAQKDKHLGNKGAAYISLDKVDHVTYINDAFDLDSGVAMGVQMNNGNNGDPYSIEMRIQKDLIIPSYEKTMDAFISTMNQIDYKEFSKEHISDKNRAKDFIKGIKHQNANDCLDRAYISFCSTLMDDTKARNIFFNTLEKQGYNAVIDDWDYLMGGTVKLKGLESKSYTQTPTIVFDRSNLKETKSVPMTNEQAEYLLEKYMEDDD